MSTSYHLESVSSSPNFSSPDSEPLLVIADKTFQPGGDLRLIVDSSHDPTHMIVDSRALCRMSTVFNRMLSGDFAEGRPSSGAWQVKLPDDRPKDLTILMDIIHSHFDKVPTVIATKQLLQLLATVDKYDMFSALRPFAQRWFTSANRSSRGKNHIEMIQIAWALGHGQAFRERAMMIAKSLKEPSVSDQKNAIKYFDLGFVLDCLPNIREQCRNMIKRLCSQFYDALSESELDVLHHHPCDSQDKTTCFNEYKNHLDTIAISRNLFCLFISSRRESWPICHHSISAVMKALQSLRTILKVLHPCDLLIVLMHRINSRLRTINPVTTRHARVMQDRAFKTRVCS